MPTLCRPMVWTYMRQTCQMMSTCLQLLISLLYVDVRVGRPPAVLDWLIQIINQMQTVTSNRPTRIGQNAPEKRPCQR
jgi:hypothetical protein